MNIFATSDDPEIAARNLCNRHSVKMPTESVGMLVFAFREDSTPIANKRSHRHYKHPASIWARRTRENFNWLVEHAYVQMDEYKARYKREHAYKSHLDWVNENKRQVEFSECGFTEFARCFSSFKELLDKTIPDATLAYQEFYRLDKIDFAKWPCAKKIPDWWIGKDDRFVDKSFKNGEYTKR